MANKKPRIKVNELVLDYHYPVVQIRTTVTKTSVLVELEDHVVFLPNRLSKQFLNDRESFAIINSLNLCMAYRGTKLDPVSNEYIKLIEFIIKDDVGSSLGTY